jgi:hypothetical protein
VQSSPAKALIALCALGVAVASIVWFVRSKSTGESQRAATPVQPDSSGTELSTGPSGAKRATDPTTGTQKDSPIHFVERSRELGVVFQHVSGIDKEKYFPAANGSGLAAFDMDGDGLMDLYLLTACPLPFELKPSSPRNGLLRRTPGGVYEEVARLAGLDLAAFCQGVTVGDVNSDGFPDILLVCLGGNHLLINQGDSTFRDVSEEAGVADERWGASAAFLDYDEDGNLDFYVANYGLWSLESNLYCGDQARGIRVFCRPSYITPDVHSLYRNRGDGTFEWATERAGIARNDGRGQGVVAADVNADGHIDLYVANDLSPHFLFLGRGDGTFQDVTTLSGAAFDADGVARAGMGVDATDLDGDGLPELFVTHFAHEFNTLYHNLGQGFFEDIAALSRLGPDSLPEVGWGTMLTDLDNDGLPDALVVNGHVDDNLAEMGGDEPYRERAKVWRNRSGLRFDHVSERAGEYFSSAHVARGAAFADLDDDGRLDVAVCNLDDNPAVLMNDGSPENGWIRFRLTGRRSNRDAVGAMVQVKAGPLHLWRALKGGGSYLSAHDLRVLVGVGQAARVDEAIITWPSGAQTTLKDLELRQTISLVEPM